jgi:DNA processing protein
MTDRRYWIGFNKVRGIGPAKLRALLDPFGDLETAWNAPRNALVEAGLDRRAVQSLEAARTGMDLSKLVDGVAKAGLSAVCWDDDDYPSRLRTIDNPPPLIFIRGNLVPEDEWAVAIVGTCGPPLTGAMWPTNWHGVWLPPVLRL